MEGINKIVVFLMDNLISVALITIVLVIMWAAVGVDVRTPNNDVRGLSKVVKDQMGTLVPPK